MVTYQYVVPDCTCAVCTCVRVCVRVCVCVQMNVGIKGVVPGEPTEKYVQRQLLLCKFWVRDTHTHTPTHARAPYWRCGRGLCRERRVRERGVRVCVCAQGGLALGLLAVAAHVFDSVCLSVLGCSLSATSLLIIVGTVIQSSRQVRTHTHTYTHTRCRSSLGMSAITSHVSLSARKRQAANST